MAKKTIRLYKYHSLGNDFLLYESNRTELPKAVIGRLASKWCHRHTGIGADGLLWLRASSRDLADTRVDIFNSDGSWAERSGNGQRIVGVHLKLKRKTRKSEFDIQTSVGIARVIVSLKKSAVESTAFLTPPDFRTASLPMLSSDETVLGKRMKFADKQLTVTCVSVGNPHVVVHTDRPIEDWREIGSVIEHDRRFPKRTNVEFVQVESPKKLSVMVWERGAGATGSSGTGAAASLAAMVVSGQTKRAVTINFPAGQMKAAWRSDDSEISTTAPVECVGMIEMAR